MRTRFTDTIYFTGLGAILLGDTIYEGFGSSLIHTGLILILTACVLFFYGKE